MGQDAKVLEVLAKYEEVLPKSNTHTRLAIELIGPGPEFEQKLIKFIKPLLTKGVPSTLTDIKPLYSNPGKAQIIGNLLSQMCAQMEKDMSLLATDEEE